MTGPSPRRVLFVLALAVLLAKSVWFTGTAVLPQLAAAWGRGLDVTAWLTMAVQLGFVVGALVSAAFNLPDVFPAPRVFVASALATAGANAAFGLIAGQSIAGAIGWRFLTGFFLAGVYPPAMKILTGWFREGRGLALGILIGALTVGTALPHGVNALGYLAALEWKWVVWVSSGCAVLAAVLVALWVPEGPQRAPQPPFRVTQLGEVFANRSLLLANLGYLGHMWELYSMWGWIAVILGASASMDWKTSGSGVALAAFLAIALGGVGCVWAGRIADRGPHEGGVRVARRAWVTIGAMGVSAASCIVAALVFDNFAALVAVSLVWGLAVVADSAQFSAIVSEVSDERYVGTALTMQTAMGFFLTIVSLRVTAAIGGNYGWRWAAASLAIGPVLGILAMLPLTRRD